MPCQFVVVIFGDILPTVLNERAVGADRACRGIGRPWLYRPLLVKGILLAEWGVESHKANYLTS
jgi:hypothetical protein